jgi:hypothetical protein
MTDKPGSTDFSAAIEELRQLAREPYESPAEMVRLRHRISTERQRAHRNILERVAKQANVDLQLIFDEAQRRNTVKRRYVTRTLERLEASASERAKAQKKKFHDIRADHIRTFGNLLARPPQLKFHQPIATSSNARPGECGVIIGYMCSPPDLGNHEASADFGPDPVGVWLHMFIDSDLGDCEEMIPAKSLHDLTYQMGPPSESFAVSSIRIDLIANGVAKSHFGDPGFLTNVNPNYVHSFIDMTLYIAQLVNGDWQQWPLLSDRVFIGNGEYVKQIRLLLSGQTYPAAIVIRNPNVGGGDILCHMQLVCSAEGIGTDGRIGIDFRAPDHGIFVGGVTLLGEFV